MKAGQTKVAIDAFADSLSAENAREAAARLRRLSPIFSGLTARPMTDLLELLDEVALEPRQAPEITTADTIGDVIRSLRNLEAFLAKTSTRSKRDDLIAFRTHLQRHESASVEALVCAVQVLRRGQSDERLMEPSPGEFAEQLKAALGHDEQFQPLFKRLSGLKAKGVASIANLLMSSGTSGSRQRDLDRIRERHEAQRSLIAKQRAMAGRTAA